MIKKKLKNLVILPTFLLAGAQPAFAIDEVELRVARYFQSDLSGSCEVCSTFNGLIEVKNLGPEKNVVVHHDDPFGVNWGAEEATYVGPSREGYEYWSFSKGILGSGNLPFAISYTVNGETYWDNNYGADYNVYSGTPLINDDRQKILLSRNEAPIIFRYPGKISYIGSINLKDLGYEKKVAVRYSTDGWQTWTETPAYYNRPEDNGAERWGFSIDLPLTEENIELALSYTVNGETYWDNNQGRNYRFRLPTIPTTQRLIPAGQR